MNRVRLGLLLAVWLSVVGCDQTAPPAVSVSPPSSEPTQAQPRLPTVKLHLGVNEVVTEIAGSEREMQTGMMFRTNMPEMEAMIFVFPGPDGRSFWMKNTLVPLSCAYINPDGVVLEIYDMKPKDTTPIPSRSGDIQYVLEVNQGWFERHNVKVGTVVRSEKGALGETFYRRR